MRAELRFRYEMVTCVLVLVLSILYGLIQEEFTDWSDVYGFNMTPMAQKAMESRLGE